METEKVAVDQIDREAAADTYEGGHLPDPCCPPKVVARKMRDGLLDDSSYVQAFARHRLSAEARSAGEREATLLDALRLIEQAHDDLCGTRSTETYLRMVNVDKATDQLDALDCARRNARELLAGNGVIEHCGKPVQMLLYCPKCGLQHIDEPDEHTPEWDNPPHKSHLCHGCGCIWRPADVPTEGVKSIETVGKADNWTPPRAYLTYPDAPSSAGRGGVGEAREHLQAVREYLLEGSVYTLTILGEVDAAIAALSQQPAATEETAP